MPIRSTVEQSCFLGLVSSESDDPVTLLVLHSYKVRWTMQTFDDLAQSRRAWINEVLVPWCRQANRKELLKALLDWPNLAGQVAPQATLWVWAWSRFPALVHDGLPGLSETNEVRVVLRSGQVVSGYPDNRESDQGQLVLLVLGRDNRFAYAAPISIDDIDFVEFARPEEVVTPCPLPDRPLTQMTDLHDPAVRI